jgi:hypothetical protein
VERRGGRGMGHGTTPGGEMRWMGGVSMSVVGTSASWHLARVRVRMKSRSQSSVLDFVICKAQKLKH